jgi:hypothetical protein
MQKLINVVTLWQLSGYSNPATTIAEFTQCDNAARRNAINLDCDDQNATDLWLLKDDNQFIALAFMQGYWQTHYNCGQVSLAAAHLVPEAHAKVLQRHVDAISGWNR